MSAAGTPRTRSRVRRLVAGGLAGALLAGLGVWSTAVAQTADDAGVLSIHSLSNRADLLSAGDVLLEVRLPAGVAPDGVRVDVDGRDVTDAFAVRPDGRYYGRVEGLPDGPQVVTARAADGRGARMSLVNHPRGGPVFSGPQVQEWVCTTEAAGLGPPQDEQCNGDTTYRYHYKPVDPALPFQDYDPEAPPPPGTVATTTTDEGETVPYVVRVERGTLNRAIYDVAVLFDPEAPMSPWEPQPGWNRKLLYSFGGGCAPGHSQADPQNPLIDMALSRGFAVAVSSLNVMGNACNFHISAETAMMVKERIVEQYGPIRYTIGNGCSGGAEAQNSLAENYPGLLDGIRPECTFADGWTPAVFSKSDCHLLTRYFNETSPALWASVADRGAVLGNPTDSHCEEMEALGSAPQDWDPTTGCGADDEPWIYHPETNREGTRCTLQDYHVAVLGERATDGFANGVLDDVGVQWGLEAVKAGDITVEQFVDLNEKVGGWTIDYTPQAGRTQGDVDGIRRFYESGQFTWARNLAETPTIDARTNNTVDFHGNIHREVVRARQLRTTGNTDAQVYWLQAPPPPEAAFGLVTPATQERTLVVMDDWLSRIEADTAEGSRLEKVVRNKPEDAVEGACIDPATGSTLASAAPCDLNYVENSLARIVAGGPKTSDVLKCELTPLTPETYAGQGIEVTQEQFARLAAAFPTGVCDWSRPGVGVQAPMGSWITLADGPPGRPLGAAPVSVPFGGIPASSGAGSETPGAGDDAAAAQPRAGSRALPATGPADGAAAAGALLLVLAYVFRPRARAREEAGRAHL